MGTLTLPRHGLVYIDAQIAIDSVETHAKYWPILRPMWEAATAGPVCLVSSELTLLEVSVAPIRSGDEILTAAYEALFDSPEASLLPISRSVLREAARLRATIPAMRAPDAIHAAAALLANAALFVTNDRGFRRVPDLPVVLLDDVLAA